MNCEDAKRYLFLQSYGELTFDEEEALEHHVSACESCRMERASADKMETLLAQGEAGVPAGLLAKCRRDLAAAIEEERTPGVLSTISGLWRRWVVNPPMWLRPAGALAMLAIGFMAARWTPENPRLAQIVETGTEKPVVSRVRFVNPDQSGQVRVMFDEVRQRELIGSMSDEPIRRLLLAAAADPSDAGLRVESMNILKEHCSDEDVRKALVHALRTDTNAGVRLKALEGLRPYAGDPETRKALSQVLLSDSNPGVRAMAIDLLIESKQPEVVGVLQESLRREENNYVRSRSQKALTDMKASVGTF
jgi:hypothetical protein